MAHCRTRLLLGLATVTICLVATPNSPAADAVSPNLSESPAPGAPITFTVAWDAGDLSGYIVIQPHRSEGRLGGCPIEVQPGATTSCTLASGLPAGTYLWWVEYQRTTCIGDYCFQQSGRGFIGVFSVWAPPPPPPQPLPPSPKPLLPPSVALPTSTKDIHSAPRLPSSDTFDGGRSIKNTGLTSLVYKTMKLVAKPRTLAVACWSADDFESVSGGTTRHEGAVTLAFWTPRQPRWLHLSTTVCLDFQDLLDTGPPTGRRAASLVTALHEAVHAHGIRNEARTNCYAVQLAPYAARNLGMSSGQAAYVGKLARNYTRRTAPPGYWNAAQCRDGGRWDLEPERVNL